MKHTKNERTQSVADHTFYERVEGPTTIVVYYDVLKKKNLRNNE